VFVPFKNDKKTARVELTKVTHYDMTNMFRRDKYHNCLAVAEAISF